MKKLIMVLMVLVFVVTGCSDKSHTSNVDQQKQSITPATESMQPDSTELPTKIAVKKPTNQPTLVQLTSDNPNVGCSTEKGYVYITKQWGAEGPFFNLCYLDFETKQESYLCKDKDCNHMTNQCQSCINSEIGDGGAEVFTDGKKIYLLVNCIQKEGAVLRKDEAGVKAKSPEIKATLYSMELDGSDRRKVFEFNQGETVNNKVFCDGKRLIMLVENLTPTPIDNKKVYMKADSKQLIELSLDSYQRKDIMEIKPDIKVAGCAADYLIVAKEEFGSQYPMEQIVNSPLKMQEAKITEVISFFTLDIKSKQQSPIIQLNADGAKSYAVTNEFLYYGIEKTGKIMKVDVTNGQESELGTAPSENISEYYKGLLILKGFQPYTTEPGTIMDLETGNTQDVKLVMDTSGGTIVVLGNSSTHFVVQMGYSETGGIKYALLSINDYLDQKDQYEEIKMGSNGVIVNFETFDKYVG